MLLSLFLKAFEISSCAFKPLQDGYIFTESQLLFYPIIFSDVWYETIHKTMHENTALPYK